jgi:hypothetical protein
MGRAVVNLYRSWTCYLPGVEIDKDNVDEALQHVYKILGEGSIEYTKERDVIHLLTEDSIFTFYVDKDGKIISL